MNPLGLSLKGYAIAAAALACLTALYWFSDKIGDSRQLATEHAIAKQEKATYEAEQKGRNRARACHALGPDRVWNVEFERCDRHADAVPGAGR